MACDMQNLCKNVGKGQKSSECTSLHQLDGKSSGRSSVLYAQGQSPNSEDVVDSANRTATYSLSVVRLANPDHAKLASINITDSTQRVYAICATFSSDANSSNAADSDLPGSESVQPNSTQPHSAQSDSADSNMATHVSPCAANSVLAINVSSESKWVSFQPELMFPDVEDVRVEVNGQVLSRGGDVGADMIADTSGHSNATSR